MEEIKIPKELEEQLRREAEPSQEELTAEREGMIQQILEAETPTDLTPSTLAYALGVLRGRTTEDARPSLWVHAFALHHTRDSCYQLFGVRWGEHITVRVEVLADDEKEYAWRLVLGRWEYRNPGA